jgi:hypothetical protein
MNKLIRKKLTIREYNKILSAIKTILSPIRLNCTARIKYKDKIYLIVRIK